MLFAQRIVFVLMAAVVAVTAVGARQEQHVFTEPVILDGVEYSGVEFTRIRDRLARQDQFMIYTPGPGDEILAFSSEKNYNEYRVRNGLEPQTLWPPAATDQRDVNISMPSTGGLLVTLAGTNGREPRTVPPENRLGSSIQFLSTCPGPHSTNSISWEHSNCAGEWLGFGPGVAWANLSNVGGANWNDRLSSSVAATGVNSLILYEHSNFGGALLQIPAGATRSNLGSYGFNDRASSLWTKP